MFIGEYSSGSSVTRTLIKFDLSSLPANAVISSAVLSLYCTGDNSATARTFYVYRLKRNWTYNGATWNNYDVTHAWSSAGGFHIDDCEQTDIGSRAFSATETLNQYKDFNLTPTSKSALDLGNGWLIKGDTEDNDQYQFNASDAASNKPKLVITYTSYQDLAGVIVAESVITGAYESEVIYFSGVVSGESNVIGSSVMLVCGSGVVIAAATVTGWYESGVRYFLGKITGTSGIVGAPTGGTTVYDIPAAEALRITINGTDFTNYATTDSGGLITENALTSRMDTATVTLVATDFSEKLALAAVAPWQEIIIDRVADGIIRFSGHIVRLRKEPFLGAQQAHYLVLTCQDYSALLERTHVNTSYSAKTDAYIINDLMTNYAPDFDGVTDVATGVTITTMTFNRVSVFAALEQICQETGYEWYVDENKHIHYFSEETYAAPFVLSDSGADDVAPYSAFTHTNDPSQIKNRVYVYGGTYLSNSFSETFIGDASKKIWSLAYTPAAIPVIAVDAAAQLEGIDGIDDPAYVDVLCNNAEKLIKFTNAPSNTAVILVTYQYAIPILIRASSAASYAQYGKWFDHKIIDRNISSIEEAKAQAQAIIDADAFARESVSLRTNIVGFRAGQVAHVVNAAIDLDDYFLIQRVTSRAISTIDWTTEYSIEMGEYHGDVIDLLRQWKKDHEPKMEVRDDEQLTEVLDTAETITLTDSVACIEAGQVYKWDTTLVWDEGTWS
jgi:hypothetical protein